MREKFPKGVQNIVHNLSDYLVKPDFLESIVKLSSPIKPGGYYDRTVNKFLNSAAAELDAGKPVTGSAAMEDGIRKVTPIAKIAAAIKPFLPELSEIELYVNAIQLYWVKCDALSEMKAALNYKKYREGRKRVDEMIKSLNTTGLNISLGQSKGKVFLKLSDRSQLSNGELDVMNFATSLVLAREKLSKQVSILIIDEVFDYLDDANLLIAQYFLLQMMEAYKSAGKSLYPILLTHIDPHLMASYRFKVKHVCYFSKESVGKIKGYIRSVLADRDRCKSDDKPTYDDLSARYFHYSPDDGSRCSTEEYLKSKGVPENLRSVKGFRDKCRAELESCISNGAYDIPMTCCALRTTIEEAAYRQIISPAGKKEFERANGTDAKLAAAGKSGATIPELHHLLGIIYNPALHLDESSHKAAVIGRKLDNQIVRRMIRTAYGECRQAHIQSVRNR